jgi:hypothetical protein
MNVVQHKIAGSAAVDGLAMPAGVQLLLVFGARALLQDPALFPALRRACPAALIAGCSTAGEICGTEVLDDSIVLTAISFDATQVAMVAAEVGSADDSHRAGAALSERLLGEQLCHVLVFADGLRINGSELVQGLREALPAAVNVTGGLAGDGADFGTTLVLADEPAQPGVAVAIGFYSPSLRVGYGSVGGWDAFGPERLVTRAEGNVLYELDGESALSLYRTYLGPQAAALPAAALPAAALHFPLALHLPGSDSYVVRSVLGIDEAQQSITFAGDIPAGCTVRLMKANFNRLVDGAIRAAEDNCAQLGGQAPELAILISCIGRKRVLQQRIEEETEGVAEVLGAQAVLAGFYSYGEIAPHRALGRCELHNQTMTVTTFREA